MIFSDEIKAALADGNIASARPIVISYLDGDRILEVMNVASNIQNFPIEIFETDDGEAEFLSSDAWTPQYWTAMRVKLLSNFSKEKLLHLIEIMEYLRKKGNPRFIPKIKKVEKVEKVENPNAHGSSSNQSSSVMYGMIAIGVAVGSMFNKTVIGAFFGGAAAAALATMAFFWQNKK